MTDVRNWHTYFAHLTCGQHVVWVVARLCWEVESNGQTRLTLGQVGAVELVRCCSR